MERPVCCRAESERAAAGAASQYFVVVVVAAAAVVFDGHASRRRAPVDARTHEYKHACVEVDERPRGACGCGFCPAFGQVTWC